MREDEETALRDECEVLRETNNRLWKIAYAAQSFIRRERVNRQFERATTLALYGNETEQDAMRAKRQAQIDLEDAVDAYNADASPARREAAERP